MYRLLKLFRLIVVCYFFIIFRRNVKDVKFGVDVRVMMIQGVDIFVDVVAVIMGLKVLFSFYIDELFFNLFKKKY